MIHIVLYRPEKPQNTGNIMRTCVAINATLDIIGPLSFSLDEKALKRAGMDYIERCRFAAAMCTLKLEHTGPFEHTIDDVHRIINGK